MELEEKALGTFGYSEVEKRKEKRNVKYRRTSKRVETSKIQMA